MICFKFQTMIYTREENSQHFHRSYRSTCKASLIIERARATAIITMQILKFRHIISIATTEKIFVKINYFTNFQA